MSYEVFCLEPGCGFEALEDYPADADSARETHADQTGHDVELRWEGEVRTDGGTEVLYGHATEREQLREHLQALVAEHGPLRWPAKRIADDSELTPVQVGQYLAHLPPEELPGVEVEIFAQPQRHTIWEVRPAQGDGDAEQAEVRADGGLRSGWVCRYCNATNDIENDICEGCGRSGGRPLTDGGVVKEEQANTREWALERIHDRVTPEPDGIQNAESNVWTSQQRLKSDASKSDVIERDGVPKLVSALEQAGEVVYWHGLVAPASPEHLRAIIESERQSGVPRTILIGLCNRMLQDAPELATDGGTSLGDFGVDVEEPENPRGSGDDTPFRRDQCAAVSESTGERCGNPVSRRHDTDLCYPHSEAEDVERIDESELMTDGGLADCQHLVAGDRGSVSYGPARDHDPGEWMLGFTTQNGCFEVLLDEAAMYELWIEIQDVPWPRETTGAGELRRQLVELASGASAERLGAALDALREGKADG